jgi:hypothetical protein
LVKDCDSHLGGNVEACMDDNWHPSYPRTAGWLLQLEDVSIPPLPIHLPTVADGWGGSSSKWSMMLSRGYLEELVQHSHLRLDMGARVYLLEERSLEESAAPSQGDDLMLLRLWASHRIDTGHAAVYERRTLDGATLERAAVAVQPLLDHDLEVPLVDAAMSSPPSNYALWSPELHHAARVGLGGGLGFWRCGIRFADEAKAPRSHKMTPCALAAAAVSHVPLSEAFLRKLGWEASSLPRDLACHNPVVVGLPAYPTLRWSDPGFHEAQETLTMGPWQQALGREPGMLAPMQVLR